MKKTIAIFGCSWTRGMPENKWESWVNYYADMYPEYEFYNLAVNGTSVPFQIHIMNEFIKSHKPDKTIFQISAVKRFTYFENFNLIDYIEQGARPNVKVFNISRLSEKVHYILPGMIKNPDNFWVRDLILKRKEAQLRNFATDYFIRLNDEISNIEITAYAAWIKSKVDFCYSHADSPSPDIPKIYRILGKEKFDSYCFDTMSHFDKEGMQWIANWINTQIKI